MVGRAASLLVTRRGAAFVVASAAVVTWFVVAPHLARWSLWPAILLVSFVIIPGTLLLALIALPLWKERWQFVAAIVFALVAFGCSEAGWGLPANFAKLGAAIAAGWAFLRLFEELSWVVLVAFIIPFVDILSVWHGPTKAITQHHFGVYKAVAITFLVPGGGAAYLGPPDVLFFALFLGAAARWQLRVNWTWVATTGMYAVTVIVATAAKVGGLPALPFLSFGFFLANGDLLWTRLRRKPT
ncbi:MAG TPA: hypothetical protein VNY33_05515 [Gaiellaceae bacterium]|nr:hypothetical protein [Gaiellaceae bacterium]